MIDALAKSIGWLSTGKHRLRMFDIQLSERSETSRSSAFLRARPYMWYVERTKKCYDAVDRTFCDAIKH